MKRFSVFSFVCGAAVMLGLTNVVGSNPSHHVLELRMYHVNPGEMDALHARFGDHLDPISTRYNMRSVRYWVREDRPHSRTLFVYILEHPSRDEAKKNWDAFHDDPEGKEVKADSE